jgi:hypothetical protein
MGINIGALPREACYSTTICQEAILKTTRDPHVFDRGKCVPEAHEALPINENEIGARASGGGTHDLSQRLIFAFCCNIMAKLSLSPHALS